MVTSTMYLQGSSDFRPVPFIGIRLPMLNPPEELCLGQVFRWHCQNLCPLEPGMDPVHPGAWRKRCAGVWPKRSFPTAK